MIVSCQNFCEWHNAKELILQRNQWSDESTYSKHPVECKILYHCEATRPFTIVKPQDPFNSGETHSQEGNMENGSALRGETVCLPESLHQQSNCRTSPKSPYDAGGIVKESRSQNQCFHPIIHCFRYSYPFCLYCKPKLILWYGYRNLTTDYCYNHPKWVAKFCDLCCVYWSVHIMVYHSDECEETHEEFMHDC